MNTEAFQRIRLALERSWSAATSVCYSPDAAPSYGQCAQTAIVIQQHLGGEILRTTGWHGKGRHFYNRIAGERVDFTADQFSMPAYSYDLKYEDHLSSAEEALTETMLGQVDALRIAFRREIQSAA